MALEIAQLPCGQGCGRMSDRWVELPSYGGAARYKPMCHSCADTTQATLRRSGLVVSVDNRPPDPDWLIAYRIACGGQ